MTTTKKIVDAIEESEISSLSRLLRNKRVDTSGDDKHSFLCHAIPRGSDVVSVLLDAGASLAVCYRCGSPPLCCAVDCKDGPLVDLLLCRGASVNASNALGRNALHAAVEGVHRSNDEAAEARRCGAAAEKQWLQIVRRLIAAGVDLEARNSMGETALIMAAQTCSLNVLRVLIEAGADVDAEQSSTGAPALQFAQVSCARVLVAAGADVNAVARDGSTALQSHFVNPDMVLFLLACGATPNQEFVTEPYTYSAFVRAIAEDAAGVPPPVFPIDPISREFDVAIARRDLRDERALIRTQPLKEMRLRALEICVALEDLQLPALITQTILEHSCWPWAAQVAFHRKWNIVVAVKHFKKS
jgi:ankyrin repeat protein